MDEIIMKYSDLITQFNPEIKKIEIKDDWDGTITFEGLLVSYNGCQLPKDYYFALTDFEKEFIERLNINGPESFHLAKNLKLACSKIQAYLYAEIYEYDSSYMHKSMPKDFYSQIDGNRFLIDSFIKEAYESVKRVAEYAQDHIPFMSRSSTHTSSLGSSPEDSDVPSTESTRVKSLIVIFNNLIAKGITVCDAADSGRLAEYLIDGSFVQDTTLQIKVDNRRFKLIYDCICERFRNLTSQKNIEENKFLLKNTLKPWKSSDFSSAIYDENSKNIDKSTKPKDHDLIKSIFD